LVLFERALRMQTYTTERGVFGPGGNGGGIFSTTVQGLGSLLPYRRYDEKTMSLQAEINAVLPRLGRQNIREDGKLGPETCGAVKTIIDSGKFGGWEMPLACSGKGTPQPPVDPNIPPDAYAAPRSSTNWLLLGGAGLVLAVTGFIFHKTVRP